MFVLYQEQQVRDLAPLTGVCIVPGITSQRSCPTHKCLHCTRNNESEILPHSQVFALYQEQRVRDLAPLTGVCIVPGTTSQRSCPTHRCLYCTRNNESEILPHSQDQIRHLFHKILSINIILKSIKGHKSVEKFGKKCVLVTTWIIYINA